MSSSPPPIPPIPPRLFPPPSSFPHPPQSSVHLPPARKTTSLWTPPNNLASTAVAGRPSASTVSRHFNLQTPSRTTSTAAASRVPTTSVSRPVSVGIPSHRAPSVVPSPALLDAPDGGWGWVVVAAAFFIGCIVDGVCYSFGVFYVDLLDEFVDDSRAKIALVGSLVPGTYLFIGPLVGGLTNKYGCRAVTLVGTVIAALSIGVSSLSPNLDVLLVTYGIMMGIGFGLMYMPSIIIVGFYFTRRRALATGIAVCGSGIGTFVFAPVARVLLDSYGWRGGNQILAAVILNGLACAAVFRPLLRALRPTRVRSGVGTRVPSVMSGASGATPCRNTSSIPASVVTSPVSLLQPQPADLSPPDSPIDHTTIKRGIIFQRIIAEKERQRRDSTGSLDGTIITSDNRIVRPTSSLATTSSPPALIRSSAIAGWNTNFDPQAWTLLDRVRTIPSIAETNEMMPNGRTESNVTETDSSPFRSDERVGHFVNSASTLVPTTDDTFTFSSFIGEETTIPSSESGKDTPADADESHETDVQTVFGVEGGEEEKAEEEEMDRMSVGELERVADRVAAGPLVNRRDIFYSGSVLNIRDYQPASEMTTLDLKNNPPNSDARRKSLRARLLPVWLAFSHMLDFSQMKSVTFNVLCLSVVLPFLGMYIPFVYIADRAERLGVGPQDAAFLLSILGVCNAVGRLLTGFVADRPNVDSVLLHNMALMVAGAATCAVPLLSSYELLCVYAVVFGLGTAVFVTLKSIIVVELLGLDKLTSAFGVMGMFQGVAAYIGVPLAGVLFDLTESYTLSFVVAGSLIVLGGVVCLPVRRVKRWEQWRTKRRLAERIRTAHCHLANE